MTAAAPSVGVLGQCGMNANTTATPVAATESYEFLEEGLASEREIVRTDGIRGTRLHPVERTRQGRLTPSGNIRMQPTYAELVNLLPRIVGAASAQSGYSTYTVSDTVPVAFQTVIDRVAKVFTYTGCRVDKTVFRGGVGQPLELDLSIEALNESIGNAGTFAALTISATPPFIWADSVLTIGGTAYQVMSWECELNWFLKKDRFVNSLTRTDLPSTDFSCKVKMTLPWTADETALYDQSTPGAVVAGNINFSYLGAGGGSSGANLQFSYGGLLSPARKSPVVRSKDEITFDFETESYRNSTTSPLIVSLDATP